MERSTIVLILLVVCAVLVLGGRASGYSLSPVDKGTVQVFGSPTCPWCVKQLDYFKQKGIAYVFTDCNEQQCPSYVQGFPTLLINGDVKQGYTETAGPLTQPEF